MKSNYRTIEDLVFRVDERNSNSEANVLLGVSIDKCFICSVANTLGTDLTKYKLIRKNDFAVSLMQVSRDSRIPIARQTKYEVAMMSPAYPIFRVKNPEEILPEYLEMWFKRDEFDREAAFIAVGGVRGSMPWNEFAQMRVYVPEIEHQRKIVESYTILEDRIELKRKINDNLDWQIKVLYKEYFIMPTQAELPSGWVSKPVEECEFDISDGNYSSKYPKYNEFVPVGIPFIRGTDFVGKYISTQNALCITPEMHADLKKGHTKRGDILMSTRGEIGKIAFVPDSLVDVNINSQLVRINGNGILPRVYLAYTFLSEPIKNEIKSLITGSVQEQLPIGKLQKVHILFPDDIILKKFCDYATPMLDSILENEHEIVMLTKFQRVVLEALSRH